MEKKDFAIVTLFLILIAITGLFYFNEEVNITGFAVKEEKMPEFYGTYSIKPSFKVNVDYDFNEYNEIIEKTKTIVRDCKDDVENCINKKINTFNDGEILKAKEYNLIRKYKWSSGCGTEEERFFYDFVENYRLCLTSEEEGICEFSFLPSTENTLTIRISWDKESAKTKIWVENTDLAEMVDAEGPFVFTAGGIEESGGNKRLILKGEREDISDERGESHDIISVSFEPNTPGYSVYYPSLSKIDSDKLMIYKGTKNEKPFLSLLTKEVINNVISLKKTNPEYDSPSFFKPKRDTFKFCVKSPGKFYVYDGNKIELKNVEYKFALKLIDKNPPPPIEPIEIKDKIKDENSVLVVWGKPPVDDVKEFYIFYSEKDFKDDETEAIIEANEINKIKISENKKIEIEDVDLGACHFIESGKPCFYDEYDGSLEKNKLYFWKKENRYIYVLDDIEEKTSFNFMVIAVDHTGNMMNNKDEKQKITQLYTGNSIDDLPPGIINTIKAQSQGGKVILSWDRETYNLDGSISYDVESFNIYYKVQDLSQTTPTDNIGKTVDINEPLLFNQEPTIFKFNGVPLSAEQANCKFLINTKCQYTFSSQPELGKVHLWGVTALDEANNEHDKVFVKTLG